MSEASLPTAEEFCRRWASYFAVGVHEQHDWMLDQMTRELIAMRDHTKALEPKPQCLITRDVHGHAFVVGVRCTRDAGHPDPGTGCYFEHVEARAREALERREPCQSASFSGSSDSRSPSPFSSAGVIAGPDDVHLVEWAGQPDIQFVCDQSWTQPRWDGALTKNEDVFLSDDEPARLYTFDRERTTCAACLKSGVSSALLDHLTAEQHKPSETKEIDYAALDPGIRGFVRWLTSHGFDTTDSGDGVTKPAAGDDECETEPHVYMSVDVSAMISESHRLRKLLGPAGRIQATYSPDDKVAVLSVHGVDGGDALSTGVKTMLDPKTKVCPSAVITWEREIERETEAVESAQRRLAFAKSYLAQIKQRLAEQEARAKGESRD